MPTILLINPNASARALDMMLAAARRSGPEDLDLQGVCATGGPSMIVTGDDLARAAPEVVRLGRAAGAGTAAIIVAAFGDPGLDDLRAATHIPVIGIGEASMREAAQGQRRFGIATTTPGLVKAIEAKVVSLGLGAWFTGVRLPPGDPLVLAATPDRQEQGLAACVDACLTQDGAARVIIGGGPLSESARALHARFGPAIIEPVPAAMRQVLGVLNRTIQRLQAAPPNTQNDAQ